MSKCYVCKSNRRQLLMLSCSHDVCIKCTADNYFLNNVGKRDIRKDGKKPKKESYFCQICLEVTKIDQNTLNELKQWYITNVNPKSSSKSKQNPNTDHKKISKSRDPQIQSKIAHSFKQSQNYQPYNPIEYKEKPKDQRKMKGNRDFDSERHYPYSKNLLPDDEYEHRRNYHYEEYESGQKVEKPEYNLRKDQTIYPMPQQYQTKTLLRYRQTTMKDQKRDMYIDQAQMQYKRDINPSYKRYSKIPNKTKNGRIPLQTPVYQRPIQPRYSSHEPSEKYSATSKQRKIFGSIVKRDELKNNENLKEVVLRAKDQQRRRINSYKSEEKPHSINQKQVYQRKNHRLQTQPDSIDHRSSAQYALRQPQRNQRMINKEIQLEGQKKKAASNKKRQVYLDLIGIEHSLEQEETTDPKLWGQGEQEGEYHHPTQRNKKPQIINKFSSTGQSTNYNTQYTSTPSSKNFPKNKQNDPQTRKLYCNIHQDEQIIYYCFDCKLLICSECALYGQHKDHNIHTLKKAAFKLKETLHTLVNQLNSYFLVEEQKEQMLMEQIKEIKIESSKQKEKVKFAFENFIKNVQNKYAQVMEQLEESQTKSLSRFNSELEKTKQKCSQFFDKRNSMKNLCETFAKNPTNNHFAAPSCQCQPTKNTNPQKSNLPTQATKELRSICVYRQFDEFFEENSMTSEQKNLFNMNIEELQSKISDYQDYVNKLKPHYQKIIYPTLYNRENLSTSKGNSGSKSKDFFLETIKSRRESQELYESLKFSQTSLLIEPSKNTPQKNVEHDEFLSQNDFIEENNLQSLNLMIEKEFQSSELVELREKLKLTNVDTIIESIKEIEQIIKELRIEYRAYEVKIGSEKKF